jgi:hypothetical protein
MSELLTKQHKFMHDLALLITFVLSKGYEIAGGELQRTPEQAALNAQKGTGIKNSAHINCLAIDLKLFQGDAYLTRTEDYKFAGDYWKSLDENNRWGGDFTTLKDGNHFSVEYQGIR